MMRLSEEEIRKVKGRKLINGKTVSAAQEGPAVSTNNISSVQIIEAVVAQVTLAKSLLQVKYVLLVILLCWLSGGGVVTANAFSSKDIEQINSCLRKKRDTPVLKRQDGVCYKLSYQKLIKNVTIEAYRRHVRFSEDDLFSSPNFVKTLKADYFEFSRKLRLDELIKKKMSQDVARHIDDIYSALSFYTYDDFFLKKYRFFRNARHLIPANSEFDQLEFKYRSFQDHRTIPFEGIDKKTLKTELEDKIKKKIPSLLHISRESYYLEDLKFESGEKQGLIFVFVDCGPTRDLLEMITEDEYLSSWFIKNGRIIVVQESGPGAETYNSWNRMNPNFKMSYLLRNNSLPFLLNRGLGFPQVYFLNGKNIVHDTSRIRGFEAMMGALKKGIANDPPISD